MEAMRLVEPIAQSLAQQRRALRHDGTHEQRGARGVECRVRQRHLVGQHRTRLFRGQRLVGDEQGQPPPRIRKFLVHPLRDDPNPAGRGRGDVVVMTLVRARVDDVRLDVPRAAERRRGEPSRGAAAQTHAHRYLASDAALHVQARERVLMRIQVVGALAFVLPRWPLGLDRLDLQPEVDRHRHAVEARADVGDRSRYLDPHYSFKTLASVRASPSSSMGGSTFFSAASGSLSPERVRTTTVTPSLSIFPSRTSRNRRANGAADAGSANRPSLPARRIWAARISVSVTALIAPPDSSRAMVAPSQEAGFPMRMAEATVFGSATGLPLTMGAAPSACAPTMRGRRVARPAAWYSRKPFQ